VSGLTSSSCHAEREGEKRSPTEPVVGDFAARQNAENDIISKYVRATNYMAAVVRRRRLASVH